MWYLLSRTRSLREHNYPCSLGGKVVYLLAHVYRIWQSFLLQVFICPMMLHDQKFKTLWWLTSCISKSTLYQHGYPHWSKTASLLYSIPCQPYGRYVEQRANEHCLSTSCFFWVRVSCFLWIKKREKGSCTSC